MTDQTLFSEVDPNHESAQNVLESLVGDGKKFKDAEALAKGKIEADRFIDHIKTENARLREELSERLKMGDALEEIKNKFKGNQPPADTDGVQPSLGRDELEKIVESKLNEAVQKNTAKQNLHEAEQAIIAKLGSKEVALRYITEKSKDMGVSADWLMSVAASNPKALYSVLGLDIGTSQKSEPAQVTSPTSSVNTSAMGNSHSGANKPGTKEYYEQMRRTDPSRYWRSETQSEIYSAVKKGTYVNK